MTRYMGPLFEPPAAAPDPDDYLLRRSKQILADAEAQLVQVRQERLEMAEAETYARWCDVGDHSFSGKDRAKRSITMRRFDEDKGQDVDEIVMCCGPCAAANPLMTKLETAKPTGREAYIDRLERETRVGAYREAGDPPGPRPVLPAPVPGPDHPYPG